MKKTNKYWLSPQLSWKTFKKICDGVPDSGPTPIHGDKVLWQMLRDRSCNIYIDDKQPDDPIIVTLKPINKGDYLLKD